MAIYSLHHQPIGKSTQARPHTAAAHVRYITRKSAVSHIEAARMPNTPGRAATYLQKGEDADRKNARVIDKVTVALPRELDAQQRWQLVREFAEDVTQGRASWIAAFHDKGKDAHNPHAHLVFRDRDPATGKRVAELSEASSTERLRVLWEEYANRALASAGRLERIDRRTLKAQGIDREATIHEGPQAQQMDRRGFKPRSQARVRRNAPGARKARRTVDYGRIDGGRSRPQFNRELRATEGDAEFWAAIDADKQREELAALRAIHHPPELMVALGARRAIPHGDLRQKGIDTGILGGGLTGVRVSKLPEEGLFASRVPHDISFEAAPEWVGISAGSQEVLQPSERTIEEPAKRVEQDILHTDIVGNKNLFCKGNEMGVDDREKQILEGQLADHRAKERTSKAARDNAMEKGYMRPKLAEQSIGSYFNKHGEDKLRDKFDEFAGPSEFGVKRGNPLTKEGREKRSEANSVRKDIPGLWAAHDKDAKKLAASERAYGEKYGQAPGSGGPTESDKDGARRKLMDEMRERQKREKEREKQKGKGFGYGE